MKRLATALLVGLVLSAWTSATAMTHLVRFTSYADPATISLVGVMANGVPLTSAPMPQTPDADGAFTLPSHVLYGETTTIVLIGADGQVSAASNVQTYGGCLWDRNGDGRVGAPDMAAYLVEVGEATATAAEEASFAAAFGMRCP